MEEFEIPCPYCGEMISVEVDRSGGRTQTFTEDCSVCCRPIVYKSYEEDGEVHVQEYREDEAT